MLQGPDAAFLVALCIGTCLLFSEGAFRRLDRWQEGLVPALRLNL